MRLTEKRQRAIHRDLNQLIADAGKNSEDGRKREDQATVRFQNGIMSGVALAVQILDDQLWYDPTLKEWKKGHRP